MLERNSLTYRSKCEFIVWGKAAPRGSVKAIPRGKVVNVHGQRLREDKGTLVIDQESAVLKSWMQQIKQTAIGAWAQEHTGYSDKPFIVDITFCMDRPQSHYRTGRYAGHVKETAPKRPIVRPDLDKLTRAVNDALTKVVFKDDSQVVEMNVKKIHGYPEGVKVRLYELS